VIDVAILSVIRRWHFREGISVREIARRTKLSRNTIAKYFASGMFARAIERGDGYVRAVN
jgi:AcrR family transcriptional regulator